MRAVVRVALVSALAAGAAAQRDGVTVGTGRAGIAIRVVWLETVEPDRAGAIDGFTFPAGADYPSQEVSAVHALHPQTEVREDGDGNRSIVLAAPMEVPPDHPLLFGFATETTVFAPARRTVEPRRVSWRRPIPRDVRDRWLTDAPEYDVGDARVARAKQDLLRGEPDPLELARRLWNYVHDHLRYDLPPRPNTGAELLDLGKGLCGEYARLTVTLARACGLPAREVHAFGMFRDGPAGNDHAWAEVFLPGAGWVPLQPQEDLPEPAEFPLHYFRYLVVFRGSRFVTERRVTRHEGVIQHGDSGVGWFVEAPPDARRAIRLLQEIAAGAGDADALRRRAAAEGAAAPVLWWALAGAADDGVAARAAADLLQACRADGSALAWAKIVAASPTLVRHRLLRAAGEPDLPAAAPTFGTSRYWVFDEAMSFWEARKFCALRGGHLATLTSAAEQVFVQRLPTELGKGHRFWIGLCDPVGDGAWGWVTGEPVDYVNWAEGHPDPTKPLWSARVRVEARTPGANGGALGFSPHRWVDADPEQQKGFVCEWDRR